jgi:hypothetical protein
VKRADEILALSGIDASLAANRGINHAEQCRGHLHKPHSTQPGGRHESGEIGGGSSPDSNNDIAARETGLAQPSPTLLGHLSGLGGLCIRNGKCENLKTVLTKLLNH